MVKTVLFFLLVSAPAFASSVKMDFDDKKYILDFYGPSDNRKHAALVIIPEFWGKDDLYQPLVKSWVKEGYVVMVVDLYGNGEHTTQAEQAQKLQTEAESRGSGTPKIDQLLDVISRSIDLLKKRSNVDPKKIALIGYGYGGGLALNLAKKNSVDGLKAVVSYYGGVKKLASPAKGKIPSLFYIRPEYDSHTLQDEYKDFLKEMKSEKIDFQLLELKDTHYGFVHKDINSYGSDVGHTFMYFNQKSAAVAFDKAKKFLREKLN